MASPLYEISDIAYCKVVLHSAKYVTAVSGLLLGNSTGRNETVKIEDVLPICHSAAAQYSTPVAQCALLLAKSVAEERSLQLVGVYFGNEIADDRSIGVVPTRLADKIRQSFPKACLLMIDAPKLAPSERIKSHCFRVCARIDTHTSTWGKGTLPETSLAVSEKLLRKCDNLLSTCSAVQSIVDFEDHCADPSMDWFNKNLIAFDGEFAYTPKDKAA